jgi:hypothetical protein
MFTFDLWKVWVPVGAIVAFILAVVTLVTWVA